MSVLPVSASTPVYQPWVVAGKSVTYGQVTATWNCNVSPCPVTEPQGFKDLAETKSLQIDVTSVLGLIVTANEITTFKNSTEKTRVASVNVQTGSGNLNYSVLASMLSFPDHIYDNSGYPTINQTLPRTYLGTQRTVNLLHITNSSSSYGFSISEDIFFYWDQLTGVNLETSFLVHISSYFTITASLYFVVTATNLWLSQPDFSVTANPSSLSVAAGVPKPSVITLVSSGGFTGTAALSALTYFGGSVTTSLATSFSPNPVQLDSSGPATSTLTITASSSASLGLYTINVTATSGATTHFTLLTVFVTSPPLPQGNYRPGVAASEFVYYGQASAYWQSNIPSVPEPPFTSELEHITSVNMTVTNISGINVTADQVWSFNNGTLPASPQLTVNVATGTQTQPTLIPWFLAGGLKAGDKLYDVPVSPTINETVTTDYAGAVRVVNVLNFTSNIQGVKQTILAYWDKATGVLLERTYTISYTVSYGSTIYSATGFSQIKATKTNIQSSNPDFAIRANPSPLLLQPDTSGTATITLTSTNGFTDQVDLSLSSQPAGLICTLNPTSVELSGSATSTLPCRGSPGTYTVTVKGTSRARSQTTAEQVTVTAPSTRSPPGPSPTIFGLQPVIFYGILGVIAAVIVAAIGRAIRGRKRTPPAVVPGTPSEPPTTPATP